jgi:hypothetical protein
MSMSTEVGFVNYEEGQIDREDLARILEETADKLRSGFIKSASVAMAAQVEDNTIYLSRTFVGTNPLIEDKNVGYHIACEISNVEENQLGGLYTNFVGQIELTVDNSEGSPYWNVGFGNLPDGLVMLNIEDHCGSSDEQ